MWPFKKTRLLDQETASWHLDNFGWLVENLAYGDAFAQSGLILPDNSHFTASGLTGPALATDLFKQVKTYCGIPDWPITLIGADDSQRSDHLLDLYQPAPATMPAGTFAVEENANVVITYASSLIAEPANLIATFAHEIAHLLLATVQTEPVCEPDEHEFLADLCAVYLGFGVFLANTRFHFSQHGDTYTQGWSWKRTGYLPEHDLIYATALFIAVKKIDPAPALKHLKPHLAKRLRQALAELAAQPEALQAIRIRDSSLA